MVKHMRALLASDMVLLASGTATLEAMLAKRPMVAGYRLAPLTWFILRARRMLKIKHYTLPNILAHFHGVNNDALPVPELMQNQCNVEQLTATTLALYHDSAHRSRIVAIFEKLHHELHSNFKGDSSEHAASLIVELLEGGAQGSAKHD